MTDIILHMPAPRNPSWQAPKYCLTQQTCQLCSHPTVYRSRSGLIDHATIHHGCWYSSVGDHFVKIPAQELLAKHQKVCYGQVHHQHRVDPAWSALVAPERASSVSPPAKHGSRVSNPEAAVTWVSAQAMPSLAAPLQNTQSCTARRKGACVVQTRFIPPWITPLSPVPKKTRRTRPKWKRHRPRPCSAGHLASPRRVSSIHSLTCLALPPVPTDFLDGTTSAAPSDQFGF